MSEPTYTPRYCTTTDVINILGISLSDIAQGENQLKHWIIAMEDYVDKTTHRNFVADSQNSSKYYDAKSNAYSSREDYLFIDECMSIDSIKINGVELAEADYIVEPYNATPIRKITFNNRNIFGERKKAVEVSAKWGYSTACPEPVKYAVAVLVGGIIASFKTNVNVIKQEKVGDYSVTYETKNVSQLAEADNIIKRYTKIYV